MNLNHNPMMILMIVFTFISQVGLAGCAGSGVPFQQAFPMAINTSVD